MPKDNSFSWILRNVLGPATLNRLWGDGLSRAQDDPVALSRLLLTTRGEVSGLAIADRVLTLIEGLDDDGFAALCIALRDQFEVDTDAIIAAASAVKAKAPAALKALQDAAEPPRQELFRRLNAAPRGTARLVEFRRRLLLTLRKDPSLAPIDTDMRHLLRSWFNRGFLVPARIDWQTPAAVLEKIIAYEAVHAIDTWDDLRQRVASPDRRCFAFFHPALPDEPLIFVEVALTKGLASAIHDILDVPRPVLPPEEADSAIFYSISNCQAGLAGVSFGAFLIKQVAGDLKSELPGLRMFATLSPVPGLHRWTEAQGLKPETLAKDANALLGAAADYLLTAKDTAGRPLDPVARFHLGNGAELHRLNAGADLSPKGLAQSHGLMVNYLYDLDKVETRHEAFAASGEIASARAVRSRLTTKGATTA
ncbi:malonyl-CoA decarboxylase [Abyssibius alkaniclasticus]|uniref:malonyl-CoA decarboxylase domain-containing protein n=1 Tax=Abyssibius alkaniclasticus TaxID=2881234 RepID=UPI0023635E32|nr:malonyl-CoA decarboxylase family protein [Abyssibius alkaniclasticus]UPH70125.1 malonyl-CoA decarboxylase [Abyssibius alkaniclasticus]